MGCWLWCSPRSDGMQFNRSSNEICGSIPSLERRTDKARIYSASKGMVPGSRLVVLLDVDKNPFAQINYGTGEDVSEESIKDAGAPLTVRWHGNGFINVPFGKL